MGHTLRRRAAGVNYHHRWPSSLADRRTACEPDRRGKGYPKIVLQYLELLQWPTAGYASRRT